MNIQEFKAMSALNQHLYISDNYPANAISMGQRKPLLWVGINDSEYIVQPSIDGKRVFCPVYLAWLNMLKRCHSKKLHDKQPTYIGVEVCNEWRTFSNFKDWWLINHVDGWQLDKDLINGERLYSPDTCIFVPSWLNAFIVDCGAARGEWPVVVTYDMNRDRYQAQCRGGLHGKGKNLGYFFTPHDASKAWMDRKIAIALELKSSMDSIDTRIYQRVVEIIKEAK